MRLPRERAGAVCVPAAKWRKKPSSHNHAETESGLLAIAWNLALQSAGWHLNEASIHPSSVVQEVRTLQLILTVMSGFDLLCKLVLLSQERIFNHVGHLLPFPHFQ